MTGCSNNATENRFDINEGNSLTRKWIPEEHNSCKEELENKKISSVQYRLVIPEESKLSWLPTISFPLGAVCVWLRFESCFMFTLTLDICIFFFYYPLSPSCSRIRIATVEFRSASMSLIPRTGIKLVIGNASLTADMNWNIRTWMLYVQPHVSLDFSWWRISKSKD